ncbi:MAG TPA: TolC family protein [Candidatus Obscuribacterales bacterium]
MHTIAAHLDPRNVTVRVAVLVALNLATIDPCQAGSPQQPASSTPTAASGSLPPAAGAPVAPSGPSGYAADHQATAAPASAAVRQDPPGADGQEQSADIQVAQPDLKALITITKNLTPFQLDAYDSRPITLRETLEDAIAHNLDIRIRQADRDARKWTLFSSYGRFLPSVNASYRWQYLLGRPNIPFTGNADPIRFNTPFIITSAGFSYFGYRGGKILFTALQNRNNLRASKHQVRATLNDTLFEATKRYYNLLLNEAILQIRIRAVETSASQLQLNEDLLAGGKATRLDVLQARTQLASDRQRLIEQQVERRVAAIHLSELLNRDQGIDLTPASRLVHKVWLIKEEVKPGSLVTAAVANRPELKQYEELRLAAKKAVVIATAPLQPTFQFFGNIFGIGETLSDSFRTVTVPAPVTLPGNQQFIQRRVSRQIGPLWTIGYEIKWNIEGMGVADLGNVQAARAQARQASLEVSKQLNMVTSQVRQSYLRTLSAHRKIEETTAKVASAEEELRLSRLRFQYGVGKNIDILKAQEDYTSAQIENVEAVIDFNISQAQLLKDLGLISVSTLTSLAPLTIN